jgi:hypothetical protein
LHHAKATVNGISNVLQKETLKGDIIHRFLENVYFKEMKTMTVPTNATKAQEA